MCQLTGYLASKCEHTVRYDYAKCPEAKYNGQCFNLVHTVAPSVIDHSRPFCRSCWEDMQEEMTEDFRHERRVVTATARAQKGMTNDQISQIRIELRDQFYQKLKYSNKPLPPLPLKTSKASLSSTETTSIASEPQELESKSLRRTLKDEVYNDLQNVWQPLPDSPLLGDSYYRQFGFL